MRRFLLLVHRVPVTGEFTLNDLAGGGGRMDEVARVVSTALTLSNDLRRDTELTLLWSSEPPPRARRISLIGRRLRYLNPDERSTAALLKNALVRSAALPHDVEMSPGLTVGPVIPLDGLRQFLSAGPAVWLTEAGSPVTEWRPGTTEVGVLLSDPYDPTPAEMAVLEESGIPRISLGPRSLRSSQCVDVFHNELDRRDGVVGQAPPDGRSTDER